MKELALEFVGGGQLKGFIFRQVRFADGVYIYEVNTGSSIHYEVFERVEQGDRDFMLGGVMIHSDAKVLYPTDRWFGDKAYCCSTMEKAELRYLELVDAVRNRVKKSNQRNIE